MDRLTREEIENIRRNGVHAIRFSERTDKVIELCDLALSALSQEAVRDEALEVAAKVCEQESTGEGITGTYQASWGRYLAASVRALKREPNVAAQDRSTERASGERTSAGTSPSPAPAAPDVAEMVKRLRKHCEMMGHSSSGYETAMHTRNADAAEAALLAKLGQGWIPVSERLPEQGSSVLVLMDGKHHAVADVSQLNTDEPGFFVRGSFWRWENASHWMPLPPVPGASDD